MSRNQSSYQPCQLFLLPGSRLQYIPQHNLSPYIVKWFSSKNQGILSFLSPLSYTTITIRHQDIKSLLLQKFKRKGAAQFINGRASPFPGQKINDPNTWRHDDHSQYNPFQKNAASRLTAFLPGFVPNILPYIHFCWFLLVCDSRSLKRTNCNPFNILLKLYNPWLYNPMVL